MPGHVRRHYRGDYAKRAAAVRAAAYGDPGTRCWRCGLTLEQRRQANPKATWDAGHVNDGEVGGLLLPECSTCNRSAGASYGNAKRESLSRRWRD